MRTEHAVEALRDLRTPQAIVIREGRRLTIASRELVCGDLLVVQEGGRVSADGWVIEANALQVDEAVLTGESVAVTKTALDAEISGEVPLPGGEGVPYAFSGTLVVRGTGLVRVAATGLHTRIGAIGHSLSYLEPETPRLLLQTRWLVRWFAAAGLGVSALAVLLYGLLRGGWLEALLSGNHANRELEPGKKNCHNSCGLWRSSGTGPRQFSSTACMIKWMGVFIVRWPASMH